MLVPLSPQSRSVVVLCLGLVLSGSAIAAPPDRRAIKRTQDDQVAEEQAKLAEQFNSRLGEAMKAAANSQQAAQLESVARQFPGNESTWYVLVFQSNSERSKSREIRLVQGKIAAARAIVKFLEAHPRIVRNPASYTRWLELDAYPNEWLARMRHQAVVDYTRRSGYR